ncbi:MAG TPA: hypothetical protein VKZ56_02435 [Membranihabitans sp.]|nr:hypothetical protein [Membranihabitans sp.]
MKRNITSLELLQNSDFINWIKSREGAHSSWHDWIKQDPANEKMYLQAKAVILSIETNEEESVSEKLKSIWDNIQKETKP